MKKTVTALCALAVIAFLLSGCTDILSKVNRNQDIPAFTLTLNAAMGGSLKAYSDDAYTQEITDLSAIVQGTTVYLKAVPVHSELEVVGIMGADNYAAGSDKASVTLDGAKTVSASFVTKEEFFFTGIFSSSVAISGYLGSSPVVVIPERIRGTVVTSIEMYAFANCSGLTGVTIPNSVTSIGESAFAGCSGLTGVTIPNSVTSIGQRAFSGNSGLTGVTIPNSVTFIASNAFFGCSSLTGIGVDSGNTSYCSLEGVLFDYNKTTLVMYPAGKTGSAYAIPNSVTSIEMYAFANCSGLTGVTIPNSVTFIGMYAFADCSGLTGVTIPNSVTSIGDAAFAGCSGLTSARVENATPPSQSSVFFDCTALTKIEVPQASVAAYKADTFWSTYKNIISGYTE